MKLAQLRKQAEAAFGKRCGVFIIEYDDGTCDVGHDALRGQRLPTLESARAAMAAAGIKEEGVIRYHVVFNKL